MSDEELRAVERAAAAGDTGALARLPALRCRLGCCDHARLGVSEKLHTRLVIEGLHTEDEIRRMYVSGLLNRVLDRDLLIELAMRLVWLDVPAVKISGEARLPETWEGMR